MLKKYHNLWVFGDSYSTPGVCVDPAESFWGLTASNLKIDTILNCSRPVNSFDTIQQLLVGVHQQIDWKNDLVFVGIPPLERITVFDEYKNTPYVGHKINSNTWSSEEFNIESHRGLVCLQNYGSDKQLILHHDRSWLETNVLRQIFFLTQWLDALNAKYLILNLSKDFNKNNRWGPSEYLLDYCLAHPKTIIFENTYHGINIGVNKPADSDSPEGHHGPEGNKYFFKGSLLPKLLSCELC